MTRSARVLSVGLSLTNDSNISRKGPHQHQIWLQQSGLGGVWLEAAPYEDRFAAVLARHEPETAHKYADVWLEVNGPPFQRFVDPLVDLNGPQGGLDAPSSYWQTLSRGPVPLARWTLPRIKEVRTSAWRDTFIRLEWMVINTAASAPNESVEVIFLADLPDSPALHLSSDLGSTSASGDYSKAYTFEIQLLSGQATVLNVDTAVSVGAGACLRFQGDLILRTEGDEPAVWKVVVITLKNENKNNKECAIPTYHMLRVRSHITRAYMPSPRALHTTPRAPGPSQFRYCFVLNN